MLNSFFGIAVKGVTSLVRNTRIGKDLIGLTNPVIDGAKQVLVVGGKGKMGSSILAGLSFDESLSLSAITPNLPNDPIARVDYHSSPSEVKKEYDVICFAVKPQKSSEVIPAYRNKLKKDGVIISVLAGTPISKIASFFKDQTAIVRMMPQITHGGITGAVANQYLTPESIEIVEKLITPRSKILWVENEDKLNRLTAVSGSGPAYLFEIAQKGVESLKALGVDELLAKNYILKNMLSAAEFALSGDNRSLRELRDAAIMYHGIISLGFGAVIGSKDLQSRFNDTLDAAYKRACDLAYTSTQSSSETEKKTSFDEIAVKDSPYGKDKLYQLVENSGGDVACFFEIARMFSEGAKKLGFTQKEAETLVLYTMRSSAEMALSSKESLEQLREDVTSPQGTTYFGLKQLTRGEGGLRPFFDDIFNASLKAISNPIGATSVLSSVIDKDRASKRSQINEVLTEKPSSTILSPEMTRAVQIWRQN